MNNTNDNFINKQVEQIEERISAIEDMENIGNEDKEAIVSKIENIFVRQEVLEHRAEMNTLNTKIEEAGQKYEAMLENWKYDADEYKDYKENISKIREEYDNKIKECLDSMNDTEKNEYSELKNELNEIYKERDEAIKTIKDIEGTLNSKYEERAELCDQRDKLKQGSKEAFDGGDRQAAGLYKRERIEIEGKIEALDKEKAPEEAIKLQEARQTLSVDKVMVNAVKGDIKSIEDSSGISSVRKEYHSQTNRLVQSIGGGDKRKISTYDDRIKLENRIDSLDMQFKEKATQIDKLNSLVSQKQEITRFDKQISVMKAEGKDTQALETRLDSLSSKYKDNLKDYIKTSVSSAVTGVVSGVNTFSAVVNCLNHPTPSNILRAYKAISNISKSISSSIEATTSKLIDPELELKETDIRAEKDSTVDAEKEDISKEEEIEKSKEAEMDAEKTSQTDSEAENEKSKEDSVEESEKDKNKEDSLEESEKTKDELAENQESSSDESKEKDKDAQQEEESHDKEKDSESDTEEKEDVEEDSDKEKDEDLEEDSEEETEDEESEDEDKEEDSEEESEEVETEDDDKEEDSEEKADDEESEDEDREDEKDNEESSPDDSEDSIDKEDEEQDSEELDNPDSETEDEELSEEETEMDEKETSEEELDQEKEETEQDSDKEPSDKEDGEKSDDSKENESEENSDEEEPDDEESDDEEADEESEDEDEAENSDEDENEDDDEEEEEPSSDEENTDESSDDENDEDNSDDVDEEDTSDDTFENSVSNDDDIVISGSDDTNSNDSIDESDLSKDSDVTSEEFDNAFSSIGDAMDVLSGKETIPDKIASELKSEVKGKAVEGIAELTGASNPVVGGAMKILEMGAGAIFLNSYVTDIKNEPALNDTVANIDSANIPTQESFYDSFGPEINNIAEESSIPSRNDLEYSSAEMKTEDAFGEMLKQEGYFDMNQQNIDKILDGYDRIEFSFEGEPDEIETDAPELDKTDNSDIPDVEIDVPEMDSPHIEEPMMEPFIGQMDWIDKSYVFSENLHDFGSDAISSMFTGIGLDDATMGNFFYEVDDLFDKMGVKDVMDTIADFSVDANECWREEMHRIEYSVQEGVEDVAEGIDYALEDMEEKGVLESLGDAWVTGIKDIFG